MFIMFCTSNLGRERRTVVRDKEIDKFNNFNGQEEGRRKRRNREKPSDEDKSNKTPI